MKKTLSIIIPVYNVEKYIRTCIESAKHQAIKNSEIIIIDDGSTDRSGKICDEYKDNNTIVIHQKNQGLSEARNAGIKKASGKYILFLDGDDYLNSDISLNSMLKDENTDIVQYKFIYKYDSPNRLTYLKDRVVNNRVGGIREQLSQLIEQGQMSGCATDKLIKTSIIKNNSIYFEKGKMSEDIDWCLRLYQKTKKIKICNENLYVYRQNRQGAITNKIKRKNVEDIFETIMNWYNHEYDDEEIKQIYLSFIAYHYISLLPHLNNKNCTVEMKNKIYAMKDILKYDKNPKVRLCNKAIKVFGLKCSVRIFRIYISMKNRGIIKL